MFFKPLIFETLYYAVIYNTGLQFCFYIEHSGGGSFPCRFSILVCVIEMGEGIKDPLVRKVFAT